jgi:hypothetical protein
MLIINKGDTKCNMIVQNATDLADYFITAM